MAIRPRRSALFIPAANAKAIEKGRTLAADVVILDLEDAVAPDEKQSARAAAMVAVRDGGYGDRDVVIRVNAVETPWGADDLVAAADAQPHAVLIPKVAGSDDVMRAAAALAPQTRLWIMMETPAAVLDAGRILAVARDPVSRLDVAVMGTNDLAKETRARLTPGRPALLAHLCHCVAAARMYGLDILDGVYNDVRDVAGLEAECVAGRDLGMDGKTLIHPSQIEICNRIFAPDAGEIAWAERVVAAFAAPENANKGVLTIGGRMVERLHVDMARRTLDVAAAIAARP